MFGPESAHSPNADDLNALYWVLLAIAVALALAINGALIWLAMRYRTARGSEPRRLRSRRPAQVLVAGSFGVLALVLFVLGVVFTESASDVEPSGPDGLQASSQLTAQRDLSIPVDTEPLTITASGQQWLWRYEYPDGTYSYYELVVPVDTAVLVELDSTDVVHRWWVPGLGGKFDVVPNQVSRTWFKADTEGVYYGSSYQFSGASYAAMRTEVQVVSPTEYQAWLTQQADDIAAAQDFVQEELAIRGEPGTRSGAASVQPVGGEQ
ncbi:MAG: cytochrome c oxidase subunit II [Actinobacteria bacterium]|nr:cytochrome c oxidase subunit II [Actinomycetota bacterium]